MLKSTNLTRRQMIAGSSTAAAGLLLGQTACNAQPERRGPTLRVVTYNIHHGQGTDGKFDYQRQADLINSLSPDVVAVQEVDRGTNRASEDKQAEILGKLCEMQFAFGNAMHYDGGEYGEAILSKHPMTGAKTHSLPYRFGQEPRAALAVRIEPKGGLPPFAFVGTHLCHQSSETRTEQAKQLNHLFSAVSEMPIVLAGDLNARPGSPPMQELLGKHWRDAIAPASVIDYVLYRQADPWRVVETKIVDDLVASDHRPVLAVLEWTGNQANGNG